MLSFSGCSKIKSIVSNYNNEPETSFDSSKKDDGMDLSTTGEITTVEETKPFYQDDENICVTTNVNLREEPDVNSDVLTVIDEFEKLKRIKTNEKWDYVSYEGINGYVASMYIKELGSTYVEVDISDQNLYLYVDDELSLSADVVTGKKDKYDTRLGCHSIYSKETNRYLKGDGYNVYVNYWLPFDKGQGLHDATWRTSFEKDDYLNGSHGCVNMKEEDAKYVYENITVGTKVLVHR